MPDEDAARGERTRVSVIIPTKNRSALLRQALASIRALEGPDLDLDLVVADNGSTDNTEAVAAEFGARLVKASRPGAAATRNAGMRVAAGDFIAFLDDDDVWTADHLRPHLGMLSTRPELGAVVSQAVPCDNALRPVGPPWPAAHSADGDLFAEFLAEYPQIGATVARASALDSVGDQDEGLLGDQDWDWHLRLALRWPIGFVPVPSVLFRQRSQDGAGEDELQWGRLRFFRRVFLRNVRRAGGRRPPYRQLVRLYVNLTGRYYYYFLGSAQRHGASERRTALRCLYRACVASPPHAARGLFRRDGVRTVLLATLLGGRGSRTQAAAGDPPPEA